MALDKQGKLKPGSLEEFDAQNEAREEASSQRCEIVRDEEGYETFLCGGPEAESGGEE